MYSVLSYPSTTGYLQAACELPGAPKRAHLGPTLLGRRMGDQLAMPAIDCGIIYVCSGASRHGELQW